jgi:tetratricopeptide (TPR) repeat protein
MYSRCLAKLALNSNMTPQSLEMQKIVLSNRSQSYLKLKRYQEAENDASDALILDSEHLKSLQRRGTARYYLGKLRQSAKDFHQAQLI